MALYDGFYQNSKFYTQRDLSLLYIPIHKNASTKFNEVFDSAMWKPLSCLNIINGDYSFFVKVQAFTILRNPYERWLTGFCAYVEDDRETTYNMSLHNLTREFVNTPHICDILSLFFNTCYCFDFDWHTKLQCSFFNSIDFPADYDPKSIIDISNITFFRLNEKTGRSINKFLQSKKILIPINNSVSNSRKTNGNNDLYLALSNFFDSNQNIKQRLMNYLEPDYKFIETVKFYND
jgi:hypothetical protein